MTMSFLLHGIGACHVCSYFISFSIASSPLLPNALSLSLILSCVIMMFACVFGSTIDCSSYCASVNCTVIFGLGCRLYLSFVLISVSPSSAFSDSLLLAFISDVMFMSSIVKYLSDYFFSSSGVVCVLSCVFSGSCSGVSSSFVLSFCSFSCTPVIVSSSCCS